MDNKEYESIIALLWKKAMSIPADRYREESLRQLQQFYICSIIEGTNLKLDEIPSGLEAKINDLSHDVTDLKAHDDISRLLAEQIGFEHQNEVSPFGDLATELSCDDLQFMSIDMANLKDRIAIEFYGPSHFIGLGNEGRVENGKTKMKSRILMKLGWKVIKIPWYEFHPIIKGKTWKLKQIEYLKRKYRKLKGKP